MDRPAGRWASEWGAGEAEQLHAQAGQPAGRLSGITGKHMHPKPRLSVGASARNSPPARPQMEQVRRQHNNSDHATTTARKLPQPRQWQNTPSRL